MNAGNLMAVSTADGTSAGTGVQGARNVSAASRTQTASGKNTFSDTMGALQKKGMSADATKIRPVIPRCLPYRISLRRRGRTGWRRTHRM